jgi:hypothetical protein
VKLWERVVTVLSVTVAIVLTVWFVTAISWSVVQVVGWIVGLRIGLGIVAVIVIWIRRRVTLRRRARFRGRYCYRETYTDACGDSPERRYQD